VNKKSSKAATRSDFENSYATWSNHRTLKHIIGYFEGRFISYLKLLFYFFKVNYNIELEW